jgi:glucuronide carrier protein
VTATTALPAGVGRHVLPPPLRRVQYVGYGAGDAANNLAFSMSSMFLLFYYTDVVGISAAAAGTLLLVVRVWDAVADLLAGRLVDTTSTRWGRFRPFLLFGSVPLLALGVAIFSVPGFGPGGRLAYAYVTYALFGLAYSLVNIPYGSLGTAMTQHPEERARLSSARILGSNLAILVLAVVVAPQIKGSGNLQRSLTATTVAFLVVGVVLYLFAFVTSRERVARDERAVSLRQAASTIRQNTPLLLLSLSALTFLTGWYSLQTVAIYYARDVLRNANLYIVMTVVQTAGVFAAAALVPWLVATIGKKRAYLAFGVVAVAGGVAVTLAPTSVVAIPIVAFGVFGIGLGGVNTLMFALAADTVEYGEWKTGFRIEGQIYAAFSFTRKVGQGVGAAVAAFVIGVGGYVSHSPTQSGSAVTAIKIAAGAVPAVFILVALAIIATYPLTEDRFRRIVRQVAERRAARRSGDVVPAFQR